MLTDDELRRIMPNLPQADRQKYLPHLQAAMNEFGITTVLRGAAFLASLAVESMELRRMTENLNYSAQGLRGTFPKYFTPALAAAYARQPQKIANRVYANRMGNGPESSGDGWKYRGRGAIQITGKENYTTFGAALGVDYVNNPDQAAQPEEAFRTAGAFWKSKGLNALADQGNFAEVSRRINGRFPPHGWPERQKYYAVAKQVLSSGSRAAAPPATRSPSGPTAAPPAGAATRSIAPDAPTPAAPPANTPTAPPPAAAATAERAVPTTLSRGVYPGQESTAAAKAATQGAAKSSAAAKGGAKKGAAKKSASKVTQKGAAKKTAARKSSPILMGGKTTGAKGAAKKGAAKKGATKKAATKKSGGIGKAIAGIAAVIKDVAKAATGAKGAAKKGGGKKGRS